MGCIFLSKEALCLTSKGERKRNKEKKKKTKERERERERETCQQLGIAEWLTLYFGSYLGSLHIFYKGKFYYILIFKF